MLYHGTSLDSAKAIIRTKAIKGKTWHEGFKLLTNKKKEYGISTSRRPIKGVDDMLFPVIFVIDPVKVRYRYKMTPVDYYTNLSSDKRIQREKFYRTDEFEEFIRTKSLPLDVLTKIMIVDEPYYDDDELKIVKYIKKSSPVPVEMIKSSLG